MCDGVWEQGTVERREESVTIFGNQVTGERRGQRMTMFGNRVLERGEEGV